MPQICGLETWKDTSMNQQQETTAHILNMWINAHEALVGKKPKRISLTKAMFDEYKKSIKDLEEVYGMKHSGNFVFRGVKVTEQIEVK